MASDKVPNYFTRGDQKVSLPTKWATDKEATKLWTRHRTDFFELTKQGLVPLTLNHFENHDETSHKIKNKKDLSSDKLLSYLGKHRDGAINLNRLKAQADASKIDWTSTEKQKLTVTVSEELSHGGQATYEYDITVNMDLQPITVKHVYYENKETALRTSAVKDEILKFNGESETVSVSAPNLSNERFTFQQMMLDNKVLGSATSQTVSFSDQPQTLYIQYIGESWIESVANQLVFNGVKDFDSQELPHLGESPIEIVVKSTDYQPNWQLTAQASPFLIEKNKENAMLNLMVDGKNISNQREVIYEGKEAEAKVTIGKSTLLPKSKHKNAMLFVGPESYEWAELDVTYQSEIQWYLERTKEIGQGLTGHHLPSKAGDQTNDN